MIFTKLFFNDTISFIKDKVMLILEKEYWRFTRYFKLSYRVSFNGEPIPTKRSFTQYTYVIYKLRIIFVLL